MNLDLIKLLVIFVSILVILRFKLPLYVAILSGTAIAALLFQLPLNVIGETSVKSITHINTITSVGVLYLISLLEHLLKARDQMGVAQRSLSGLFNNNRVNASVVPMFIGLLPSPGSVLMAAPFVEEATKGTYGPDENAFIANYFRHIPESFLPVYTTTIIAVQMSGQSMSGFLLASLPMAAALYLIGYIFYIRKIPKNTEVAAEAATQESGEKVLSKKDHFVNLCKSTWSIILIIVLVLVFPKVNINICILAVIALYLVVQKIKWSEIKPLFKSSLNVSLLITTASAMLFKDIVTATGIIPKLPEMFANLPIPMFMIFGIIFFFGTIVAGLMAMITLVVPMAMVAIPGAGIPLLVFLMYFGYSGGLLNPTHVCLLLCCEYFKIELKDLLKRSVLPIMVFLVVATLYYLGLNLIM